MRLSKNQFDPNPYFTKPVLLMITGPQYTTGYFDHNGYVLSPLEILYHKHAKTYRGDWEHSNRQEWFHQSPRHEGAVMNHSWLFQRKGFAGEAREYLEELTKNDPSIWKVLNIRPKWGIDVSIDFYDSSGRCFEVLHYEWDGFDLDEVKEKKLEVERIVVNTDWDLAAEEVWDKRNEWMGLDFFEASNWRCEFFGLSPERFKESAWYKPAMEV